MAVIFNITEALDNMAFNALNLPIQLQISALAEQFERDSKITSVFKMHTMDGYQDSMYDDTEMSMFKPTADLEVPGLDDFQNGYSKSWTTHIWTNAFAISKQSIEDGTHGSTLQDKVSKFTRTYYRTREEFGSAALAGALTTKFTFVVGDKSATFDSTCNDSVDATLTGKKRPFFSQYHATPVISAKAVAGKTYTVGTGAANNTTYTSVGNLTGAGSADYKAGILATDKIADGTILATIPQSNKFSLDKKLNIFLTSHMLAEDANGTTGGAITNATGAGFQGRLNSYEIFEKILDVIDFTTFTNHKGYRGERMPIDGKKTIIIPSFPIWKSFIESALMERKLSNYDIVTWAYLNNQVGFDNNDLSMVILDKALNNTDKGLMFLDRIDLTMENHIDPKTKAYTWDGRARFGSGNGRFYTAAYLNCGVPTTGAALFDNTGAAITAPARVAPTNVSVYDSTMIYTDTFTTTWTKI